MTPALASVIVPVYNQADHIETALNEFRDALQRLDFPCELIPVVNGQRRDRSLEICRQMAALDPLIRPLSVEQAGWGRSVRAGLAAARGELICYTNSARTSGKDLLLMLLYGSVHPDTIVKANRKIRESPLRRAGSLLYNLECRMLFDLPYWDINGTPKVFSREHHAALLGLECNDDLIDLEFNAICRARSYPVIEVPVFSTSRRSGKSTTNWQSALRMYTGAWRLRSRMPK